MTAYYVRSGASGTADGSSWANAKTTMASALSGKAAGDIFYVSEDHNETTAGTVDLAFPGTNANPNMVYCVDHTGSVPPVSADLRTTASIATSTSAYNINFGGAFYIYGVQFKNSPVNGSCTVSPTGTGVLESCTLAIQGTGGGSLTLGANGVLGRIILINPTITFASTSSLINLRSFVEWRGGSACLTGAVTGSLFYLASNNTSMARLQGVDLSAFGTGKYIVYNDIANPCLVTLDRCKLGAGVAPSSVPTNIGGPWTDMINCDSGGTNYRNEKYRYEGTLTTETTIVRSGGATDGTTPVSHKIVTTANSKWPQPFESFPIAIWNDTVGSSVTATVYGIWGGGAVPNNDDIWIETSYLGSSGSPIASFVSSGKADGLASNSALASDASSWGGSTTAFKMSVTFTPQQKGLISLIVRAAKASSTFYIDPKIELS